MNPVTRRAALARISAGGFGSLLAASHAAAAAPPAPKQELFVLGPFSLGDWYKKYRKGKGKRNIVFGAPDDAEIIESLDECKFYVIDLRVWKEKDRVHFSDSKDGYPHLVAGGKLIHSWKEKGKNCTIWVKKLSAAADHTDYDASPPFRRLRLHVTIDIEGENRLVTQTSTHGFFSDRTISYDITGKELPAKR